jgi:hypothetical protein
MVAVFVLMTLGSQRPLGAPTGALPFALSTAGLAVVAATAAERRPHGPGERS